MNKRLNTILNSQKSIIENNAKLTPSAQKWRNSIPFEDIRKLYAEQGHKCAICGEPKPDDKNHKLDHDHATGRMRGILCNKCNLALGLFNDDVYVLQQAIDYIKKYQM